jgi:mercuric ion transport protein
VGTLASIAALFSAAACCVLPLGLAALGIGAGGLAAFVPFRWPLTIGAAVAVAVGWGLYARKRRACAADASCTTAPPAKATVVMLSIASLSVALSALWGFIEQPLMRALGGA